MTSACGRCSSRSSVRFCSSRSPRCSAPDAIPAHDPATLETDVPGIFIAGVVVAGYDANKVFIENGRFHGDQIVARILGRPAPPPAKVSRDLDS